MDTSTPQITTTRPPVPMTDLLSRIRAEYMEVPGLNLTKQQVGRFWSLDAALCEKLLGELVDAGFLTLTRSGRYARTDIWR